MPEAPLADSGSGLAPSDAGWFVVNVRDAEWWTSETFGSGCAFESRDAWFSEFGINISVLEPGSSNCLYHSESDQYSGWRQPIGEPIDERPPARNLRIRTEREL